jgi:hypothetical protein
MSTKSAALLCAIAAAVAAPSAGAVATTAATPSAGAFGGATSQRKSISFTVSRTHRSIGRKSTKLALTCPDGYASIFTISKPIPVVIRHGTFNSSWTGTSSLGAPYKIRFAGRFASAKRASGTIQITITYPQHGACGSGSVSWSARHR